MRHRHAGWHERAHSLSDVSLAGPKQVGGDQASNDSERYSESAAADACQKHHQHPRADAFASPTTMSGMAEFTESKKTARRTMVSFPP